MRRVGWMIGTVVSLHAQWDDSLLQKSAEMYDEARAKTIAIYQETLHSLQPQTSSSPQTRQAYLDQAWMEQSETLKQGADLLEEMRHVPESAWLGRDRSDVRRDFIQTLNRLLSGLTHTSFGTLKERLETLRRKHADNQKTIAFYREKRLSAPDESTFRMTKEAYTRRIDELRMHNRDIQSEIDAIKAKLHIRLRAMGVTLNEAQLDVLLTRIDGDDIIKMALVVDVVNDMTKRLADLIGHNNHTLEQTKRYYAMYEVLQELVVYMYQNYIDTCDQTYLPNIDRIIKDAKAMIDRTEELQGHEDDPSRRKVYAANAKALKETLSVAIRYRDDLIRSKASIQEAKHEALKNLQLVKNTYKTVMLSSDLYALIQESREAFLRIEKIQIPPIVPFENQAVKQAYEQVTRQLK